MTVRMNMRISKRCKGHITVPDPTEWLESLNLPKSPQIFVYMRVDMILTLRRVTQTLASVCRTQFLFKFVEVRFCTRRVPPKLILLSVMYISLDSCGLFG